MILLLMALAQDPAYGTVTLRAERADGLVARDLDADGRRDLVVQEGRDLRVFLSDGTIGPDPDHTVRLEGGAFLWTFGTLAGRERPALLSAGSRAVTARSFDGRAFGTPTDLVVHPSLFPPLDAGGKPPLRMDFAPDLDGDGRSDVLLFRRDSIFLMRQQEDGSFRCLQKLPVAVGTRAGLPPVPTLPLTETVEVPVLAFGDTDGDGRTDVSRYHEETLGIFLQQATGTFAEMRETELVTSRKKKRRRRFFRFEVPPWIGDFNADGLLDVAVCYCSKGRVHLFYGRPGRTDYSKPDDVKQVNDAWSTGIYTEDLDGDGRLDMIMGVIRKFGVTEGIDVFLSGRISIELHVYAMQASGTYTKDPVQELTFSIPYALQVTRESATVDLTFRPNFSGDVDGDGRRDLLVAADGPALDVYPGVAGRLLSDRPTGRISMAPPPEATHTELFTADLNADGRSDLLLKHVLPGRRRHVLELKLSR